MENKKIEKKKVLTKEEQVKELLQKGFSRRQLQLCKNDNCNNTRRIGSSYCQECSNKHNE